MQDVCYLNDSQVVILSAKKIFSVQPGVNIAIFTID
jgi:Holliday junction resolvase RusA-like endonuclease